jgi:hypothetical protein
MAILLGQKICIQKTANPSQSYGLSHEMPIAPDIHRFFIKYNYNNCETITYANNLADFYMKEELLI